MVPALVIKAFEQNNAPVGVSSPNRRHRLPLPTPRIPGDGPQPPKGGNPPIPVLGAAALVGGWALGPGAKGRTRRVAPPEDGAEGCPLHTQVRHAPRCGNCAHPQLGVVQEQLRARGVPEAVPTPRQRILYSHGAWGDPVDRLQQAHFANPVVAVLGMRESGNRCGTPPSHDRRREPVLRSSGVLRVLGWLPVRSSAGSAPTSAGSHHQKENKGLSQEAEKVGGGALRPHNLVTQIPCAPPPLDASTPPGKVASEDSDRVDSRPSSKECPR